MNNRAINTKDAAILSEIVYLQNTFEPAVEKENYKNLKNVFYNSNGQVRANIDTDFAKRLTMHKDYYQKTLEKYRLVEVSSRLLNSNQQATGYYGIAVEAIANPGETHIYNRGTETASIQGFLQDFSSDIALASGEISDQADAGINFAEQILDKSQDQEANYNISSIGFGGHSLGGSLAQILSVYFYQTGLVSTTHTFEAYGTLENITQAEDASSAGLWDIFNNNNSNLDLSAKYNAIDKEALNGLINNYIHPNDRIAMVSEHIGSVTEIASANDAAFGLGLDYHRIDNYVYQAYDNNGELMPHQLNIDAVNQLYQALNLSLEGLNQEMVELSKTAFEGIKMREFGGGLISDNPEDLHKFIAISLQHKQLANVIKDYNDRFNAMENYNQTDFAGVGDIEVSNNTVLAEQLNKLLSIDFNIANFNNIALEDSVNQGFISLNIQFLGDPLIFDLDDDGIETISSDNKIMFDHNGDGIEYATGWVAKDDALLVRDIDNNGTIDNGTELFGDNTYKKNGNKAEDGFDALADLDSNQDGMINAEDTAFSSLKLWQDQNQDGISQANELTNIVDTGINKINLNASAVSQTTPGGVIYKTGQYIKDNNIQGTVAALHFTENHFYRKSQSDEPIPANIVNIQGHGALNSLYYSAKQNSELLSTLRQFMKTRDMSLPRKILLQWVKTAENFTTSLEIIEGVTLADGTIIKSQVSSHIRDIIEKTAILEAVNGSRLIEYHISDLGDSYNISVRTGAEFFGAQTVEKGSTLIVKDYSFHRLESTQRIRIVNQAYASVEASLFTGLENFQILNLKENLLELLQKTSVIVDETGSAQLDWSGVKSYLSDQVNQFALGTLNRLHALHKKAGEKFKQMGFDIKAYTESILSAPNNKVLAQLSSSSELIFFGKSYHYISASIEQMALDNTLNGSSENEIIYGLGGDDSIESGKGDDVVYGGEGDDIINNISGVDKLYGDKGDDILSSSGHNEMLYGGKGNDTLYARGYSGTLYGGEGNDALHSAGGGYGWWNILSGGTGNDVYVGHRLANARYIYNIGDGFDAISLIKGVYGSLISNDIVQFGADISFADLSLHKQQNNLLIEVGSAENDRILIENFYSTSRYNRSKVSKFEFADGTVILKADERLNLPVLGSDLADALQGSDFGEELQGGLGDDVINASGGADNIFAGDGNDTVYAGSGNDIVYGGLGDDMLDSQNGADQLYGGAGNDTLYAHGNNGTLYGGEGNDTLYSAGGWSSSWNTLSGGPGNDAYIGQHFTNARYVYNLGDDFDTISLIKGIYGKPFSNDIVQFGADVSFSDLSLHKQQNNLLIEVGSAENDRILIENFYSTSRYARTKVAKFEFANGDILNKAAVQEGSGLDDTLVVKSNNALNYLAGMNGNDTYEIDMSNAGTTLINNADSDGGEDRLMLEGTSAEDLWFYREMSHLMIRNLADEHSITVQNWFDSPDNQIDQVMTDEMILHQRQVDQLIQEMAAFNVASGAGEIILNPEQEDQMSSIIANTWSVKKVS